MTLKWRTDASFETLRRRAQVLNALRLFFAQRQVLEVETPLLSPFAPTAPYLDSLKTNISSLTTDKQSIQYLQTSPEFAMKRLLAQGSGSIYQISKAFRNGEQGHHHSPEFTLVEWYRLGLSLEQLMTEVEQLLSEVAHFKSALRLSYAEAFMRYLGLDVYKATKSELKQTAVSRLSGIDDAMSLDRDGWLELLMSQVIEPEFAKLKQPVIVFHFPASQAQLAKIIENDSGHQVAARFEVYAGGLELANGYDELQDSTELKQRFEFDNTRRQQLNKPTMPIAIDLLAALESGLPACTGIALGLDRLLMVMLNKKTISEVMAS